MKGYVVPLSLFQGCDFFIHVVEYKNPFIHMSISAIHECIMPLLYTAYCQVKQWLSRKKAAAFKKSMQAVEPVTSFHSLTQWFM